MKYQKIAALALLFLSQQALAITVGYDRNGQLRDARASPTAGSLLSGVISLSNTGRCTGSLIAPNIVLTAAHCDGVIGGKATVALYNADGTFKTSHSRNITSFVTHPGYNTRLDAVQPNDIALAFLDTGFSSDVRTYKFGMFSNFNEINGMGAMFAGYGVVSGGNSTTYTTPALGRDRAGNMLYELSYGYNRIERVAQNGSVFLTDFDGPGINTFGEAGYAREVGTSSGDSGSAVFYNPFQAFELACSINPGMGGCPGTGISIKPLPDENFIIGVTSFSQYRGCNASDLACVNRFGTLDGYTFVTPFLDWIQSTSGLHVADIASSVATFDVDRTGTGTFEFDPSAFQPLVPPPDPSDVPLPGTIWLFIPGLAMLFGRRIHPQSGQPRRSAPS